MSQKKCYWKTQWCDLREGTHLRLKDGVLKKLLKKAISENGNLNRVCKMSGLSYQSCLGVLRRGRNGITVKKLGYLAKIVKKKEEYFNEKITEIRKGKMASIKNPKLPFDVSNKHGAYILGCVVSDGTVYTDTKARNVLRTKYSSSEQESTRRFKRAIKQVFGDVHIQEEITRGNTYTRIGSSAIGEALVRAGAIVGNKTENNKGVPHLIKDKTRLVPFYLGAVFADEGTAARQGAKHAYIAITRYKGLDKVLTDAEKRRCNYWFSGCMTGHKFPTGHTSMSICKGRAKEVLPQEIYEKIMKNAVPRLLREEAQLLRKEGIEGKLWAGRIVKTQSGKYRTAVTLIIRRKRSVIRFYKEIGFSLSRKQKLLEKNLKEAKWI